MCDAMTTMNNTKEQYVYIMSNPSFDDDVFKIGWTREHPAIRANDLQTSGVPTPFVVESVIITTEGVKLEKQVHDHLKQYRMENNREFFKISKNDLDEILTSELQLVLTSISELCVPFNKPKLCKMNVVYKLKQQQETLQQKYDDFINKFKNENTKFIVSDVPDINNKYRVTICKGENENEYKNNCLTNVYWDDYANSIVQSLYFIQRSINYIKDDIDNVTRNYDEIKSRIGTARLRGDNKCVEDSILENDKAIDSLKNKYKWEF